MHAPTCAWRPRTLRAHLRRRTLSWITTQGWLTRASQASRMTSRTCASAPTCLAQPHLANPRRAILHFGFRGRSPGDALGEEPPFPCAIGSHQQPYLAQSDGIRRTAVAPHRTSHEPRFHPGFLSISKPIVFIKTSRRPGFLVVVEGRHPRGYSRKPRLPRDSSLAMW